MKDLGKLYKEVYADSHEAALNAIYQEGWSDAVLSMLNPPAPTTAPKHVDVYVDRGTDVDIHLNDAPQP